MVTPAGFTVLARGEYKWDCRYAPVQHVPLVQAVQALTSFLPRDAGEDKGGGLNELDFLNELSGFSGKPVDTQARIGLIIPSGNTLTERQFNHYTPAEVGIHVARLRMTGKFRKPLEELKRPLTEAAEALSDIKPSVMVFHCTANSMENGVAHERAIVEIVERASGCPTLTTAQAITQAFDHCGIKKLVLISPYVKATNQLEVNYLTEMGYTVLHEQGLALESQGYSAITPQRWIEVVRENTRTHADGYFLSCTNTQMIDAIENLEAELGKPVVNSNQATLWACLKFLGISHADKRLGMLFQ
jgi:maleate cis-trans isomerase